MPRPAPGLNAVIREVDDVAPYPVCIALAEGSLSGTGFAAWLCTHLRIEGAGEVHEPRAAYKR